MGDTDNLRNDEVKTREITEETGSGQDGDVSTQREGEGKISEKAQRKVKAKAKEQAAAMRSPARMIRLLFIGNSLSYYNSGIWFHLHKLCRAANIKVECSKVVKGGASLEVMWTGEDDHIGEDGLSKARGAVIKGEHDIVVLQEDLPETTVESFWKYTKLFVDDARAAAAKQPGDEQAVNPLSEEENTAAQSSLLSDETSNTQHRDVLLLMTWEYSRLGWISQEQIAAAHKAIARELNVAIAPAGMAWLACSMQRPALELYMSDREHPSINGTYLTACVVFASVFLRAKPTGEGGVTTGGAGGGGAGTTKSTTQQEEQEQEGEDATKSTTQPGATTSTNTTAAAAKTAAAAETTTQQRGGGGGASALRERLAIISQSEAAEEMRRGGLAYRPGGVSAEDAAFMQRLACEIVAETEM